MSQNVSDPAIEIRVEQITQLFHTLDPFPFRERDLDQDVEEYIVGWARELRSDVPVRIVIHMPEAEAKTKRASELKGAFEHYFTYRAQVVDRELRELIRIGWRSLAVGISILAVCLTASHLAASHLAPTTFAGVVQESFLILGWVANWRPLEIFLYDWWPLARRRDLYYRLASAKVEVSSYPVTPP